MSGLLEAILGHAPERRPVDLIITNMLHGVAAHLERLPADKRAEVLANSDALSNIARDVLVAIAREAPAAAVLAGLTAATGIASTDEMAQRLQAVVESRAASGVSS